MAQNLREGVGEEEEVEEEEELNSERHRGRNATVVTVGGNEADQSIEGN